jgi:glycosyltransferase involved in cell wall biosynthesis
MDKRPVHFVVETGSLAGGVRIIGEMANRLAAKGWTVTIWSVNPKETLTNWFHLDSRIKWHSFFRQGTIEDYDQLAAVLAKQRGIKIATFWRTALVVKAAAEPGEGYYLVQDVETSYTSQPAMAAFVMDTYAYGLKMITTSKWVCTQLPEATYVGIGVDNFYDLQPKLKRLGYPLACARPQALKGWSELAETARYLARAGYPLVTYGLQKELSFVAHHAHNVDPRSMQPNLAKLTDAQVRAHYCQAGVFIATSRHEGFSLTPLEAMRCGAVVVMTPADGNLEYARDGENCLLRRTPRELADTAVEVMRNLPRYRDLAAAGAKTARRYSWSPVIERLEAALTQVETAA